MPLSPSVIDNNHKHDLHYIVPVKPFATTEKGEKKEREIYGAVNIFEWMFKHW